MLTEEEWALLDEEFFETLKMIETIAPECKKEVEELRAFAIQAREARE